MIPAVLAGAFFAVWLLFSVINQFEYGRLLGRVKEYDVASLIPTWTFFAPRPGTSDYELIYRDVTSDATVTPWKSPPRPPPSVWRFLWHPQKRREKLITDCVLSFLPDYDPSRLDHLLGVPYLLLLSLIEAEPHDFRAVQSQFAIVSVTGETVDASTTELLFVSEFIRIPGAR